MKIKLLFKALKFACLPTLSMLTLLICGFFSISKAIAWISSDAGLAIFLRVALVIAEIVLIYIMYEHYREEEQKKDIVTNTEMYLNRQKARTYSRSSEFRSISATNSSDDIFYIHDTEIPNTYIIEHIKK